MNTDHKQLYIKTTIVLAILTIIEIGIAYWEIPRFSQIGLLLTFALSKMACVAYVFMHLYYDKKTNLIFFLGSVVFLCIFIVFTLMDINYRKEIYEIKGASPFESYQDLNRLEKTGGEHHHDEHDHEHHEDSRH